MEIKTKFNIGDKVFFMHNNRVKEDSIDEIKISVHRRLFDSYDIYVDTEIQYVIGKHNGRDCLLEFKEDEIFATKNELLKSL